MSDKIPVLKVSPTDLSMSAINQHCSTSEPGYSWCTALTNIWYGAVVLANSDKFSQSSTVSQSMNCRACPFISTSSTTCDHANWKLRSLKKWWIPCGLVRSNCGAPRCARGQIPRLSDGKGTDKTGDKATLCGYATGQTTKRSPKDP